MSEHMWLAAVITDEGAEDACDRLAAEHGIVVGPDGEGPDEVTAGDVLPDVWSDGEVP